MKEFFYLFLIVYGLPASACICGDYHRDMDRAYKEYSFIAHVKIIKRELLTTSDSGLVNQKDQLSHYRKVTIKIIELFKGNEGTMILESGAGTSCEMGLSENSEWILCGNYLNKGIASVFSCDPSFSIKNAEEERLWLYDSGREAAKKLRVLAGLPPKPVTEGRVVSYFAGGAIAVSEAYKNGLLHGERTIYFSNGVLMEQAEFLDGVPTGTKRTFKKSGQPDNEFNYSNGIITHSVFWYDTSYQDRKMDMLFSDDPPGKAVMPPARLQKQSEGWYDTLSGNRRSVVYYRSGELQRELFSYNEDELKTSCEYFKSGGLKFESYILKAGDITVEKRWNESGQLISEKRWVKGKYQGEAIKNK